MAEELTTEEFEEVESTIRYEIHAAYVQAYGRIQKGKEPTEKQKGILIGLETALAIIDAKVTPLKSRFKFNLAELKASITRLHL